MRGASHQPAYMGNCLTIWQTCLPCPPSGRVSPCIPCPLIIGLMVVLLTFFGCDEYGFSTVGVGVILGNRWWIQEQNYVELLQGSGMTAGCHYKDQILCICFRLTTLDVSQWCSGWHMGVSIQLPRIVSGKGRIWFAFQC